MQVKLEALKAAYDVISDVPSSTLDTSQTIRLVAKKSVIELTLTGLIMGQARCPATGEPWPKPVYVDRRCFGAFVGTARAEHVELGVKEARLTMVSGQQKASLANTVIKSGYSEWGGEGEAVKLPEWLVADLPVLAEYAATAPGLEHLSAIALDAKYGALSSDSLTFMAVLSGDVKASVLIPGPLAVLAAKRQPEALVTDKSGMAIRFAAGSLYQPRSERTAKFPAAKLKTYADAAVDAKPLVTFVAATLKDGLAQVKALAANANVNAVVSSVGAKPRISVSVEQEKSTVQCNIGCKTCGNSYQAVWPLARIEPFVARVAKEKEATIMCGRAETSSWFRADIGGRRYILVVVDVQ